MTETEPSTPRDWPAHASDDYATARKQLIDAEVSLLAEVKRVAELRRALPLGAAMPEYMFTEGPTDLASDEPMEDTTLADLVGDRELLLYQMMYGPDWDDGCPSCSMWIDGLHGVAHHLAQRMNFAVIVKAPLPKLRTWARHRGWQGLRLLSSDNTTFNADTGAEDEAGNQWPRISVFTKHDGAVHHRYSTAMIDNSGDLLSPVWHAEDLLPTGRGDWEPSNAYAGDTRG